MSGEAGARGVTGEVDAGFSDILDNLEIGAMGAFAATHGRWVVLGDTIFAGLGGTKEGTLSKVDIDVDMLILETDLGYAVADNFQVFGGARYIDLESKTVVRVGPVERTGRGGEAWIDPVVGARFFIPIGGRGAVWLRGDVGGFGVGSDMTWNAVGGFTYQLRESASLAAGYRVLDIDYHQGSGNDEFLYDVQMAGPLVGLVLHW